MTRTNPNEPGLAALGEARLLTPIILKTRRDAEWPPGEQCFYLLASSGLFMCREHRFFRSCVEAPRYPAELEEQEAFLEPNFPRVPRRPIEQIVGFFGHVWEEHGGEAAVLLAWNDRTERVEVIVPEQVATVRRSYYGDRYPIGLHYSVPSNLPPHTVVYGDVHSHCDFAAYSSATDRDDEVYRSGLHAVVGRLNDETPEFHVEAVVDGTRFRLDTRIVFGSYRERSRDFPREWLERVKVEEQASLWSRQGGYR